MGVPLQNFILTATVECGFGWGEGDGVFFKWTVDE